MEVSFIVPVYNVRNFILECIESLLEIKNIEYEVLIINDGSTDDSISVISSLMGNPALKIFHQENRGLSAARNVGLKNAKGTYVALIDGDDKINASLFEQLYKKGMRTNPDIIIGDFLYWKKDELIESGKSLNRDYSFCGKDLLRKYYKSITSITCRNLYKRKFLLKNNLYFVDGIYFEDVEWMPRVYYLAEDIAYFAIPFYHYRQRESSITKSVFSLKKFEDCWTIAYRHLELSRRIEPNLKFLFRENAFYCIYKAVAYYLHSENETNNRYVLKTLPLIYSEGSIGMKFFFFLYRKFPSLLVYGLSFMKK